MAWKQEWTHFLEIWKSTLHRDPRISKEEGKSVDDFITGNRYSTRLLVAFGNVDTMHDVYTKETGLEKKKADAQSLRTAVSELEERRAEFLDHLAKDVHMKDHETQKRYVTQLKDYFELHKRKITELAAAATHEVSVMEAEASKPAPPAAAPKPAAAPNWQGAAHTGPAGAKPMIGAKKTVQP
jgi:hypothetical protein